MEEALCYEVPDRPSGNDNIKMVAKNSEILFMIESKPQEIDRHFGGLYSQRFYFDFELGGGGEFIFCFRSIKQQIGTWFLMADENQRIPFRDGR
jgi:hypothetical protein